MCILLILYFEMLYMFDVYIALLFSSLKNLCTCAILLPPISKCDQNSEMRLCEPKKFVKKKEAKFHDLS
jgi:hypothetical protein